MTTPDPAIDHTKGIAQLAADLSAAADSERLRLERRRERLERLQETRRQRDRERNIAVEQESTK